MLASSAAWTVGTVDGIQRRKQHRSPRTRLHSVWSGLQLVVLADTLRKSGSACLAITSAVSRKLEHRPTWCVGACRGVGRCWGEGPVSPGLYGSDEHGTVSWRHPTPVPNLRVALFYWLTGFGCPSTRDKWSSGIQLLPVHGTNDSVSPVTPTLAFARNSSIRRMPML